MDFRDEYIVSEGYRRTKKASLAYSGIIIALAFVATPISWLGVQLPVGAAKFLFFWPALYFTAAFFAEWRTAKARNSALFRNENAKHVDDRLRQLGEQFERIKTELSNKVGYFQHVSTEAIERLKKFEFTDEFATTRILQDYERKTATWGMLKPLGEEQISKILEELHLKLTRARDEQSEKFKASYEAASNALARGPNQVMIELKNVGSQVESLRKDFHRLGGTYKMDQNFLFWSDIGVALVVFAIASITMKTIFSPLSWCLTPPVWLL